MRALNVSRLVPSPGGKQAQPQTEPKLKPAKHQTGGNRPGRHMNRIDNLLLFLVRGTLFGLIAAACGDSAVLFFRNLIDTRLGGPDFFAEFDRLGEEAAAAKTKLQAIIKMNMAEVVAAAADVKTLRAEVPENCSDAEAAAPHVRHGRSGWRQRRCSSLIVWLRPRRRLFSWRTRARPVPSNRLRMICIPNRRISISIWKCCKPTRRYRLTAGLAVSTAVPTLVRFAHSARSGS